MTPAVPAQKSARPLELHLPGGVRVGLIPGTHPPRYEGWDGSVEIPADLAGFWWHGSYLTNGRVALFTADYGFPAIWQAARRARQPEIIQLSFFEVAA